MKSGLNTGAVIVTYNPDTDFACRLRSVCSQVDKVVVVDNASSYNIEQLKDLCKIDNGRVMLIVNSSNLGVAAALNVGIEHLKSQNCDWVLTLDQDSEVGEEMVCELLKTAYAHSNVDRVALVGPNIIDRAAPTTYKWLCKGSTALIFSRKACGGKDLVGVSAVITSGSLIQMAAYSKIGAFNEGYFIDYVDTEYCLRALKMDYMIMVSGRANLYHRLGNKQTKHLFGLAFRPTYHKPFRLYYIARNRVHMIRKYGLQFPHWVAFDLCAFLYNTVRILLFEDSKLDKMAMTVAGTLDGLLGRLGPAIKANGTLIKS
jgi:rhamnosyltransferase